MNSESSEIIEHDVVFKLQPEDLQIGRAPTGPSFELFELWSAPVYFYEVSYWTVRLADGSRCPIQIMFRQDDFEQCFVAVDKRGAQLRSGFAAFARPPHMRGGLRSHALAAEFFANNPDAVVWGPFAEFDGFSAKPSFCASSDPDHPRGLYC